MFQVAPADDSDLEVETDIPKLETIVGEDLMKHWKPKEKKRQEIINGDFYSLIFLNIGVVPLIVCL